MAKIREDLVGAVHVDGHVLYAGDTVPDGVTVGDHVLDAAKPARRTRKKATAAETAAEEGEESDAVDDA